MILGVIVLRVRTILQKALTIGQKHIWSREFRSKHRFINIVCFFLEDQTYPEGAGIKDKEPDLWVVYH